MPINTFYLLRVCGSIVSAEGLHFSAFYYYDNLFCEMQCFVHDFSCVG